MTKLDKPNESIAITCSELNELVVAKGFGAKTILTLCHGIIDDRYYDLINYVIVANDYLSDHFTSECVSCGVTPVKLEIPGLPVLAGSCYIVRNVGNRANSGSTTA